MSSQLSQANLAQANAGEQSRMELQAKLNGLGGLNGRKLDPETKAKKLREACEGFESIFIQKMWQEMRNAVPKSNLLSGREEKFWQDMYDQELSKSMTKAGGIGLADMMYEQLSRNLANASSSAAGKTAGSGFTPAPAPLVVPVQENIEVAAAPVAPSAPKATAAIYEGTAPQVGGEPAAYEAKPDVPPVARRQVLVHSQTHTRQPGSGVSQSSANSGISLAYRAQREAGDKLSANAIRPSLQPQRQTRKTQTVDQPAQAETAATGFAPGSAQSLAQALELAKSGGGIQPAENPMSLNDLVTAAKLRNAQTVELAANAAATEPEAPVVRKTRFSTNIPANAKARSIKNGDPIRMLNVDNASVNSKQGQGLAAYHAAQEANSPQGSPLQPQNPAPIAPMSGQQPMQEANAANFTIPPLRAGELQG